jgi:proline iminopeptidase
VAVNGTELFVRRVGRGEPIVVVHGGPLLEHGYLAPHLEPLARTHELVFYDQRLSGRSAPRVDSGTVTLASFTDDLEQLRQTLRLGRIHLLGHSWGGLLAMRYALAHEASLRSLILLNSMSASSTLWQEEERRLAERLSAADSLDRVAVLGSDAFARQDPSAIEQLLRLGFRYQFYDPTRLADLQLYVPDDYMDRSRQFFALGPELENFDLHSDLGALSVPTLIMYGDDEPGAGLGGEALRAALRSAEFTVIENAGHFPFIEQPEAFLLAVNDFLDRHRD